MLKTTYQIFDSPAGKTIVFSNLYFINGEFIFNGSVSASEISTYPNVHYRKTNFEKWVPRIADLQEQGEIQQITAPHFYLKETLHSHPAHTLMDDVFSVFYSLYRCKLNYDTFTCVIDMLPEYDNTSFYDCKGMYKCLFGQEAITLAYFKRTYSKICFDTFVVGNGDSGLHSYDCNYAAPFQDNIWKQFRNAFYKKAEVNLESGNNIIYVDSNNSPIKENLKNILESSALAMMAVQMPASGLRPEAIAKAMASGRATMPTVRPAPASLKNLSLV